MQIHHEETTSREDQWAFRHFVSKVFYFRVEPAVDRVIRLNRVIRSWRQLNGKLQPPETQPQRIRSTRRQVAARCHQQQHSRVFETVTRVPEKSLEVTQTKNDNAAVNVTCSAEGVYPEPVIVIQRQESY
ncbi:Uncharacterized protein GBIM_02883 [Gryllus bimaculatus]|nr:Uncharacterized protein GBIM_02883 [Gryllus bimaculatus]